MTSYVRICHCVVHFKQVASTQTKSQFHLDSILYIYKNKKKDIQCCYVKYTKSVYRPSAWKNERLPGGYHSTFQPQST